MTSKLTAFIIQSRDDITVSASGPSKDGKWMGWITLGPEDNYRPLLNTKNIYDTEKKAIQVVQDIVNLIRDTDFTGKIEHNFFDKIKRILNKEVQNDDMDF